MSEDWRISEAQYSMIIDKIKRLSKKEAGLTNAFIEHCIFARRPQAYKKMEQ